MTAGNGKSNIKSQITENLRQVYDEALEEDVPDTFASLVERFKKEKAKLDKAQQNDK